MSYGILGGIIGSLIREQKDIEYVGYASGSDSSGSFTLSLSSISGLKTGDMLLVAISQDTSGPISINNGFTDIFRGAEGEDPQILLSYKIVGSTVDTSVTGSVDGFSAIMAIAFRYANSIGESSTDSSIVDGDPNPPSITTTTDKNMLLALGFIDDDAVTSFTVPSGFTSIGTASISSGVDGASVLAAYKFQESAATIDPSVMTNSGSDLWYAMTVALRPL